MRFFLLLLVATVLAAAEDTPVLFPLVERTDGKDHVVGLGARFTWIQLRTPFDPATVRVVEAKHQSDITALFDITAPTTGFVRMRFKPGMGDFGSGNRVSVTIAGRAFEPLGGKDSGDLELSTGTDVP